MWEDDEEELSEENAYDPERERKRVELLPVYQKAEEIRDLTRRIIDSIDDERVRVIHMNTMLEDSIIIPERIAAAEAVDDYVLKMENAIVVKIHARSLQNQSASLLFEGALPGEYLTLLRKEIETFRQLFKSWTKTFNASEKKDDGWGLFCDD
jgi:hypothetical protein